MALELSMLEVVQQAVAEIEKSVVDPEAAHALSDDLYRDVLRAVSTGHPDSVALALEALRVEDIEFPRWYA